MEFSDQILLFETFSNLLSGMQEEKIMHISGKKIHITLSIPSKGFSCASSRSHEFAHTAPHQQSLLH